MRRAFLDACALFPPLVRGLLLHAAAEGLIAPRWSPRVVEEWARATGRDHGPAAADLVRAEARAMAARWPEGPVEADPDPTLSLPDPADAHVLSAALNAGAELLVTFNLRDFPGPKLRALGIAPIHPDALLWELAGREPAAMARVLAAALAPFPAMAARPRADQAEVARAEPGRAEPGRVETARALRRAHLPRYAKLMRGPKP